MQELVEVFVSYLDFLMDFLLRASKWCFAGNYRDSMNNCCLWKAHIWSVIIDNFLQNISFATDNFDAQCFHLQTKPRIKSNIWW